MMVTVLLLLAPPKWQATFVPLEGAFLHNHLVVFDARKDRSAVGASYEHGADWQVEAPVVMVRGMTLRTGEGEKWMPVAFLGKDIVTRRVVYSDPKNPILRRAAFHRTGLRWKGTVDALRVAPRRRVEPLRISESIPFRREWVLPLFPKPEEYGPDDELSMKWYRLKPGVEIGSGSYRTGPADMKYPFADDYFPVVRMNGKVHALTDVTRVPPGVRLTDVLFVDPTGWFVVQASRKGKQGFAWVEPVR